MLQVDLAKSSLLAISVGRSAEQVHETLTFCLLRAGMYTRSECLPTFLLFGD